MNYWSSNILLLLALIGTRSDEFKWLGKQSGVPGPIFDFLPF